MQLIWKEGFLQLGSNKEIYKVSRILSYRKEPSAKTNPGFEILKSEKLQLL